MPPETRITPRIAPNICDVIIISIKKKFSLKFSVLNYPSAFYFTTFLSFIQTAIVIAGLKCPPEIPPKINAEIVMLKPIV